MSELYAKVGARLRSAREEARLSRRQVAEEMARRAFQISVSSLQDFEEGKRLNLDALMHLADILGRHPATLLGIGPPDDLGPADLDRLIRHSTRLRPLEKELLFAALGHIDRLRQSGASGAGPPGPATPGAIRSAILDNLGAGGAFSVKELSQRPSLAAVPEPLLRRETLYLAKAALIEAVASRPTRYALAAPADAPRRQGEPLL